MLVIVVFLSQLCLLTVLWYVQNCDPAFLTCDLVACFLNWCIKNNKKKEKEKKNNNKKQQQQNNSQVYGSS